MIAFRPCSAVRSACVITMAGSLALAQGQGAQLTPIAPPAGMPGQPGMQPMAPNPPAPPAPKLVNQELQFEGEPSAGINYRAALKPGQIIKLDLTIDQRYALSYLPPDKAGSERITVMRFGVVLTVKTVEPTQTTAELAFDNVRVEMTPSTGEPFSVDCAGPEPAAGTPARAFYDAGKALMGSRLTITLLPDNTITDVLGEDDLMKLGPARLMRRVLEADGLRAWLGPALALRPTLPQVPELTPPIKVPAGSWPATVVVLADRGRQNVGELRAVEKTEGGLTRVRGRARVTGSASNVGAGSIYLRDCSTDSVLEWDTAAGALKSGTFDDAITLIMSMPDNTRQAMSTLTNMKVVARPASPAATPAKGG